MCAGASVGVCILLGTCRAFDSSSVSAKKNIHIVCNKLSLELFSQQYHEYNWYCAPTYERMCAHQQKCLQDISHDCFVLLRCVVNDFNRCCRRERVFAHSKSRLTIANTANFWGRTLSPNKFVVVQMLIGIVTTRR